MYNRKIFVAHLGIRVYKATFKVAEASESNKNLFFKQISRVQNFDFNHR